MKRQRHGNGQLRKMNLTKDEATLRMAKTEVRAALSREHAMTRGVAVTCLQVLQRPLLGRLKWLVRGK